MFQGLSEISVSHPFIVVSLMHEVTRLVFPKDEFITDTSNSGGHQLDKLEFAINNAIKTISCYKNIGSYCVNFKDKKNSLDVKDDTGSVYGLVWHGEMEILNLW